MGREQSQINLKSKRGRTLYNNASVWVKMQNFKITVYDVSHCERFMIILYLRMVYILWDSAVELTKSVICKWNITKYPVRK